MADEVTPTEETANEPVQDTEPTQVESGVSDRGTGDGGSQELDAATLRKLLSEAREESASYRVKAREEREAREAMAGYVSPDELKAANDRAEQFELELSRTRLISKYSLPESLASRIVGTTEDERDADAKGLADAIRESGRRNIPKGSGGLDPTARVENVSPAEIAAKLPRRRA